MNKYEGNSDTQIEKMVARQWSGTLTDAEKVCKDYSQPLASLHDQGDDTSIFAGILVAVATGALAWLCAWAIWGFLL